MIEKIKLFLKLSAVSIRSEMQHRASFFMLTLSHFISTFTDIFGIWVLFDRFELIKDWSFNEVALIYGVMHMGFSFCEVFGRGFDQFPLLVKHGNFDRILLRPMNTLYQVAASEVQFLRIGRFFQGFAVLIYGFISLKLSFFSLAPIVLFFAFIGALALFYGLRILQATLSFWTIESLEIMNIATYGGLETGQYPMSIYNKPFRLIFTFIVPIACVGYYPAASLLNKEGFTLYYALAPLSGLLFLFLSCRIWKLGVIHYHSTGN